jgi:hypothetical protein
MPHNPPLMAVAAGNALVLLLLVPAALMDDTLILGISRWIKPMKFALSIAIFTATMAWLLSYLPGRPRAVRVISWTIAIAMIGEMGLLVLQAVRGVRSHFNHDTPLDEAIFGAMGLLILMNTGAVAYGGWLYLRGPVSIGGAHLSGVRLGIALFVLASLEGGLMIARDSHAVGVHDGGAGLPFVNWSTGGGDLRVAHFVGMHALQALPILGWLLEGRGIASARLWVRAAAAAWLVMTAMLVAQALAGRPLLAA